MRMENQSTFKGVEDPFELEPLHEDMKALRCSQCGMYGAVPRYYMGTTFPHDCKGYIFVPPFIGCLPLDTPFSLSYIRARERLNRRWLRRLPFLRIWWNAKGWLGDLLVRAGEAIR